MSIQQAIYDVLAHDVGLSELLAKSDINSTMPAIYEQWTPNGAPMPYINLTFDTIEGNHWGKRSTKLYIDVFTESNSKQAETIKNRLITILDRQKISLENDNSARVHSDGDRLVTEDTPNVSHWEIEFTVLYWRKTWILTTE